MKYLNRITSLSILILLVCTLVTPNAFAEGGYFGASIGKATRKNQGGPNQTDTAYKVFGGIRASGPFHAELSYVNLGTYYDDEYTGYGGYLLGNLPVNNRLVFLAKAGLFNWDIQDNTSNVSITGTDLSYGFGGTYILLNGYIVRFEWEHFADIGKINNNQGHDMTLVSLGLVFRF